MQTPGPDIIAGKAKRTKGEPPPLTESIEQQHLFKWAAYAKGRYPELELLYHIPNEGKRSRSSGARLKAEGLKAGVPDLCLPVPKGLYSGLYIEMKRQGQKPTQDQLEWLGALSKAGHVTALCYSWESAAEVIRKYLDGNISKGANL